MIPVAPSLTEIDELPGEEIEFSIGDPRWVMRSMADLYSNREIAVTREYSTNARDANIEAGNEDKPIEVTLPSQLFPYFIVKDYGTGMSADALRDVYTRFGTSTKRDSNDFNGVLGFGSKSAVAYTNTFTVTSVHNGYKSVAVITRKPDYSIVMKILSTSKTDEPNGTEISVPVHNWHEFTTKAKSFYKFWLPGTVKVNGEYPEHHVGVKIDEGLYYSKDWGTSYVVMGNVPYRIENPHALFRNAKMNFVHFVAYTDNGDVEFTPSREDLKYTPHTTAGLEKIILDYEKKIYDKAKSEIDSAKTHSEAYASWAKWTDILGRQMFDALEFKGEKFESTFSVVGSRYTPHKTGGAPAVMKISKWEVSNMSKTLMIVDYDLTVSTRHKQIVRDYIKIVNEDYRYVIFTDASDVDSPWVDKSKFVSWEDLKAKVPVVKKPAAQRQTIMRLAGSWDYWDKNKLHREQVLDGTKEMFYVTAQQANANSSFTKMLRLIDSDAIVIKVYANRLPKFLRENPGTKNFVEHFKSLIVRDEETLLSDDAKTLMGLDYRTKDFINRLDVSKIDDPRFKRFKKLISNSDGLYEAMEKNRQMASEANGGYAGYFIKHYSRGKEDDFVIKDYPLINMYGSIHPHAYIYINAVYSAERNKK